MSAFNAAVEEALVAFLTQCSMERGVFLAHDEMGVELEVEEMLDENDGGSTWGITKARFDRSVFVGMTQPETVAAMLAVLDAEEAHSVVQHELTDENNDDADALAFALDAMTFIKRDLRMDDVMLNTGRGVMQYVIGRALPSPIPVEDVLVLGVMGVARRVVAEYLERTVG